MTKYEAVWQVLDDLITELRKAGEDVPLHVVRDLRSAKTAIGILKADRDNPVHFPRIEEFLGSVESYIICTAQRRLGAQAVSSWMERLDKARSRIPEDTQPMSRFVAGIPRDKHWIRIKPDDTIPLERIKQIAEEEGLGHASRENGYIVVYGEKSGIENFIKKAGNVTRVDDSHVE